MEETHPLITNVIPLVSEGGRHLIGGVAEVSLHPPIDIKNAVVPTKITPGYRAPPGTPTLHRFVRFSAIGIPELRIEVALRSERVFSISPEGGGEITKEELLGPPIKNPRFYESDPGY